MYRLLWISTLEKIRIQNFQLDKQYIGKSRYNLTRIELLKRIRKTYYDIRFRLNCVACSSC